MHSLRLLKESVEREVCVAGQSKVLQREREHVLPALLLVGRLGQLLQAEADVQDAVDEHQVRLLSNLKKRVEVMEVTISCDVSMLYLEGGEEDVGLEEVEALVDDVLLVGGDGGRRGAPPRPLGRDPQREDGHVADELLALGRDGRVVGRHLHLRLRIYTNFGCFILPHSIALFPLFALLSVELFSSSSGAAGVAFLSLKMRERRARGDGRQEGRTSALLSNLIDCTNCHNNVLLRLVSC